MVENNKTSGKLIFPFQIKQVTEILSCDAEKLKIYKKIVQTTYHIGRRLISNQLRTIWRNINFECWILFHLPIGIFYVKETRMLNEWFSFRTVNLPLVKFTKTGYSPEELN